MIAAIENRVQEVTVRLAIGCEERERERKETIGKGSDVSDRTLNVTEVF
jgi:hypothetical protein